MTVTFITILIAGVCSTAFTAQQSSADGAWPMAAKNYANTRYSPLQQITTDNVKDLQHVITFSTGVLL